MQHTTWMFKDGALAGRILIAGLFLCLFSGCGGGLFNRGYSGTVYAPPAYGAAPTYAYQQQQPVMAAAPPVVAAPPAVVAAPPQMIAAPQYYQQPQYVQPAAYYSQQGGNACCTCPCQ